MSNPDSETWSLESFANETVQIHGRTYQQWSLDRGTSYGPVDEDERDRLNRQHQAFQLVFDNRLIFPPIPNPQKVLECGFGSAAWAVEVAEKYPECEVIGVDITPHMRPETIPPNLWLQVDDLNEPFTFQDNEFDLVHSQLVVLGIKKGRWSSYIKDCARVLKPGGWLQSVELYHNYQSDNGSLTEQHALRQLCDAHMRALEDTKDLRAPLRIESMMRDAGLVELGSRMIALPCSPWPTDARGRAIGEAWTGPFREALSGHLQLPISERLGMSMDELHVLVAQARRDLDNLNLKPYVGLYVHIGRKPFST